MRKKILVTVLVVVLVLVLVAAALVHFLGDRALKAGVETAATGALKTGVTVGDASFSVFGGTVGMNDLVIDNPPNYQHPHLLELGRAHVAVNLRSLLSDTVNIDTIELDGISLVVEQKGLSNNLQDILKAIPASPKEDTTKSSSKQLHITQLDITDINVKVKLLPLPGRADTVPLKLPPIRMTDLGSDSKLDTAQLTGKILMAIANGIVEQGPNLPTEIIGPLTSTLQAQGALILEEGMKALEEGANLGKDVIKRGHDAIEEGKDMTEGITKGLKGILGGKDDK